MSEAYNIAAWHGFFDAMLGATGGIFGLMIVAISFRADSFSSDQRLIARAAIGPVMILAEFLAMVFALMPGQTRTELGYESLFITAVVGIVLAWINVRYRLWGFLFKESPATFVLLCGSGVPLLLGEIGLVSHSFGGLVVMMIGYQGVLIGSVLGIWNMIIHHPNTLLMQLEGRIQAELDDDTLDHEHPDLLDIVNEAVARAVDRELERDT
jgi:uncharacterized membrane protein